jgi:hypothetical protein
MVGFKRIISRGYLRNSTSIIPVGKPGYTCQNYQEIWIFELKDPKFKDFFKFFHNVINLLFLYLHHPDRRSD